jgi:hypothetical protein
MERRGLEPTEITTRKHSASRDKNSTARADGARAPLLIVIEPESNSQLEKNNAANAILLSFVNSSDFSAGIRFLQNAEVTI